MKVLITGSSGYIASVLINKLASRGDTIIAVDKTSFKYQHENVHEEILDITDPDSIKDRMQNFDIDVVLHLAAVIRGKPSEVLRVNVEGTTNLLEAMLSKKPKLIIIIHERITIRLSNFFAFRIL